MKRGRTLPNAVAALSCLALLSACGSSSGGGIGGTGIVIGTIDGFGSVVVNGIEFEASVAEIVIDDTPATEGDLREGMVVTVEGEIADDELTGVADRISTETVLAGALDAVDVGAELLLGKANDRERDENREGQCSKYDEPGEQPIHEHHTIEGFAGSLSHPDGSPI